MLTLNVISHTKEIEINIPDEEQEPQARHIKNELCYHISLKQKNYDLQFQGIELDLHRPLYTYGIKNYDNIEIVIKKD